MTGDDVWPKAAIALGGNVGDVAATMGNALRSIDARRDCRVVRVSGLYKTPPWGVTDQPDFLNACAMLETRLQPDDLLSMLLELERDAGRVRADRWGPRTLDLDILDYDGRTVESETLKLPHPRMTDRAFVIVPLNDIAPDLVVGDKTISVWRSELDLSGITQSETVIGFKPVI